MIADGKDSIELVTAARGVVAEPQLAPAVLEAEFTEAQPRHLRDHLRVLYKYRWLAAACFGITFGLVAVTTLLSSRLYSATTRLQVAKDSPIHLRLADSVLNVDDEDRTVNGTSSFLATQVASLKSRDLAERVIRTNHLVDMDAFTHPGPQRGGLLAVGGRLMSVLRPRGWQATSEDAAAGHAAAGDIDPALLDRYMRYLDVHDVRGTDLIEVRFTTPSPALSALLAAAHTQAYMEATEESQLATDVAAKEFLGKQIAEARAQIDRAQNGLRAFATVHPQVAVNEEQKLVGQRVTDLSALVSKAEGSRVTMETRYQFLVKPDSDPVEYFLDRPSIQKLHLAVLDLQAQRVTLDGRLGPNHPQVEELLRNERALTAQLTSEVSREVKGVRAHYDVAVAREQGLRQKLEKLEQEAVDLRDLGSDYARLKDDVDGAIALHQSLLKQRLETSVNSALATSNVRIVERAETPLRPTSPNVPLNLAIGLLAGGACALGATFFCEYFDTSVKSTEEVETLLQMPTLATVPNFALARRSRGPRPLPAPDAVASTDIAAAATVARELVVLHEPWSPTAEAFRSLRTAVLFSTPATPPKVIQVTSGGAGEGKTVSSLNLATALAEAGSRVLLIDVDMRRPACHHALGVDKTRGLSSFLAGQLQLDDVIQTLAAPRIFFIPAGPTPPNPAELVGSQRMRDALQTLREQYDFVILDSPPVLPVTDSVLLSREADGVVLVVKGHDTPRELLRRARDQLIQANARLLGTVVNNVDLGWGDLFFYNRYYGYYAAPAVEGRA
ncbi:MAG TPA: polysaccharide biosynthesis tyrosine autokinase [Candidatus Binatia bacterium]|jgi:capsular exopolysaccharide synthesis family protein